MFETILKEITPSKEELQKIDEITSHLSIYLTTEFLKLFRRPEIVPVGSAVKGTNLAGNSDIDIFLKFDICTSEETFKGEIHDAIKKALENLGATTETNYASHPYVRGKYEGVDIDVCPCYDVPDGEHIISAVDRTPFHTEIVNRFLGEERQPEVRLLKQFLKAHYLYGANEKIQGFSGYLCELLVMRYGSFLNVLRSELEEYSYLTDPDYLEQRDFYGAKNLTMGINTPLVWLDPVDPERNVAAALSHDKFVEFIAASRLFLKYYEGMEEIDIAHRFFTVELEPEFYPKGALRGIFKSNGTPAFYIEYESDSTNEEVIHATARRKLKKLVELIGQNDFKISDSFFHVYGTTVIMTLAFEVDKLPNFKTVEGPPIDVGEEPFYAWVEKHKNFKVQNGKLVTLVERDYTDVYDSLKDHYPSAERFI